MGLKRTCVGYTRTSTPRGTELRCAEYKKGKGRPGCVFGLVGGGRSPGTSSFPLIRAKVCPQVGPSGRRRRRKR